MPYVHLHNEHGDCKPIKASVDDGVELCKGFLTSVCDSCRTWNAVEHSILLVTFFQKKFLK